MSVRSKRSSTWWLIALLVLATSLWCFFQYFATQKSHVDTQRATITIKPRDYKHHLRLQARSHAPAIATVASPIAGIVHEVHSQYGDSVSPNRALFTIASPETKQNYIDTIISFLKSKEQLLNHQKKADNSKQLFASDIISREEFQQAQNTLYTAQVDYLKVEHQLKRLCHLLGTEWIKVAQMTLKDTHVLHDLLEDETKVTVYSAAQGVFLTSAQDSSTSKHLAVITEGSKVEPGQLVGMIGEPNVLEFNLAVSEDDITSIHVGQPVTIRSLSANNRSIDGLVSAINKHPSQQKNQANNFMFGVTVQAKCPESCGITLGMNAALDIHTGDLEQVFIVPFSSVFREEHQSYVLRQSAVGDFLKHPVQTGRTLPDGIIITQGLNTGDVIASHYTMS